MLGKFKDMEPLKVRDLMVISHLVGQLVVLRVCTYGMGEQQYRAWIRYSASSHHPRLSGLLL